jgi:fumarylpyruvate hydrolase
MTALLFASPAVRIVPVVGTDLAYPVHRIFCVGRNYADHAAEMGVEVDRDAPFYFTKSLTALALSGQQIAYPPGTSDYHFEAELVIAIGKPAFRAKTSEAQAAIYGYACGLDMTRRDLQAVAKAKQRPWDTGKDVEASAIMGSITPADRFGALGSQGITLTLNGALRQNATLADMVWSVVELVSHLSQLYHLAPGDLIYTGTPAGVGPVKVGDEIRVSIDGLDTLLLTIGAPD